jgi:hypothetical protein
MDRSQIWFGGTKERNREQKKELKPSIDYWSLKNNGLLFVFSKCLF